MMIVNATNLFINSEEAIIYGELYEGINNLDSMQDYNVRIYLIYSADAYILNTTSVRFTPRRSHCALGQTVDNPVPTIF